MLFFGGQFKFDNASSYSEQVGTTNHGQIAIALGSATTCKEKRVLLYLQQIAANDWPCRMLGDLLLHTLQVSNKICPIGLVDILPCRNCSKHNSRLDLV